MYGKQKGSKALPGGTEKANKGGARKRSIDAKLKPKVWRKFVLGRIVVWLETRSKSKTAVPYEERTSKHKRRKYRVQVKTT